MVGKEMVYGNIDVCDSIDRWKKVSRLLFLLITVESFWEDKNSAKKNEASLLYFPFVNS